MTGLTGRSKNLDPTGAGRPIRFPFLVRTCNAARFLAENFGPWPAAYLASKSFITALHNCAEYRVVLI